MKIQYNGVVREMTEEEIEQIFGHLDNEAKELNDQDDNTEKV